MRRELAIIPGLAIGLTVSMASPVAGQIDEALRTLNSDAKSVAGTDDAKSYRLLFDAYLDMSDPPFPVGPDFNLITIHPGMPDWSAVSAWAESNAQMADAIIAAEDRKMLGLPYGTEGLDAAYRQAGLVADIITVDDDPRRHDFGYLAAIDTIAAFAIAETYRRMEAGDADGARDLATAHLFVARQCCDRQFLIEKLHHIQLLIDSLSVVRDLMYTYRDVIKAEHVMHFAWFQLPFLSVDRNHLFMPEGDRILSALMISQAFDPVTGMADPDRMVEIFGEIQAEQEPLARFGAVKRWRDMIALKHDGKEASLDRLTLIYDDWWRRWRVRAWDPLLDAKSQFDRTNPVRFAAVLYSLDDITRVFTARHQLLAAADGTTMAAGLAGYRAQFGKYPADLKMAYGQFVRERSDVDPFDKDHASFEYLRLGSRHSIDTPLGRVWVEPGEALLYSRGLNLEDDHAADHTDDGSHGDIIMWPPIRVLQRQAGMLP